MTGKRQGMLIPQNCKENEVVKKAPIAISGTSINIVWPAINAGNHEVVFRSSNDGGTTFGDKINLCNINDTDSINAEIATDGDNVIVTWWERANATSIDLVIRISNDNGQTFSSPLKLATNGTIGKGG